MVDPHEDPIDLVPSRYDEWRLAFEQERERIFKCLESRRLFDKLLRIEHVGSTAVPGLASKDIVDLDIVVADDDIEQVARSIETELGGTRYRNSDDWHPVFRSVDGQRFNDHVFAASSDGWKISVLTREVLVEDVELRREYESLKAELCAEHDELAAYSMGKNEFVKRVLRQAEEIHHQLDVDFPVPET